MLSCYTVHFPYYILQHVLTTIKVNDTIPMIQDTRTRSMETKTAHCQKINTGMMYMYIAVDDGSVLTVYRVYPGRNTLLFYFHFLLSLDKQTSVF